MSAISKSAAVATMLLLASVGHAAPSPGRPSVEKFVIVAGGRQVGQLEARLDGPKVSVEYRVVDNGRGPSSREEITMDSAGRPTGWTIEGQSLVGAPLREELTVRDGLLRWSADADAGSVPTQTGSLYLANNASPWALGMYARAALASPSRSVRMAPSGTLTIEPLGQAPLALPNRAYRLRGLWMEPVTVVLDRSGALLATDSDGRLMVRTDQQGSMARLRAYFDRLAVDRMAGLQAKLAHRFAGPIRLTHVRVFDPRTGAVSPLRTVVVYRDRITAIEPDGPVGDDGVTIDGEGGTLIPGLRDMHSHTSLSSNLFNLAAGVTSTRDMGNDNAFLQMLLPRLASGELPGPRIMPNGFVEGVSPYSSSEGMLAHSLDEALADIDWYARRGYFQLKIYNSVPAGWVPAMAARAHASGMGVTGHIPAFTTADAMIGAGYDEIAHTNLFMFGWILDPAEDTRTSLRINGMKRFAELDLDSSKVARTLALVRSRNTVLDTTISTEERLTLSRARQSQRGELPYLDHVPIAYQRYRKRALVTIDNADDDRRYRVAMDKMLAVIKRLYDQGTRLMPGTDDAYGFPLHRELELYVMAGIPPADALRLATLAPAQYTRQDQDLGTIERGKLADLVLVPGDPTRDISTIRQARMVMRGGTVYFPEEIYAALDVKPFGRKPVIREGTSR